MIKPPEPPDLKHCPDCGKVIGPHKGWFGAECRCDEPAGNALRGAHSAGIKRSAG
jgi:NAD-dependent SIR2 family protein deacetylase